MALVGQSGVNKAGVIGRKAAKRASMGSAAPVQKKNTRSIYPQGKNVISNGEVVGQYRSKEEAAAKASAYTSGSSKNVAVTNPYTTRKAAEASVKKNRPTYAPGTGVSAYAGNTNVPGTASPTNIDFSKRATLVNDKGEKLVVTPGSYGAQRAFSRGYKLETFTPGTTDHYGLTMEQANDPKYWKDGKFVGPSILTEAKPEVAAPVATTETTTTEQPAVTPPPERPVLKFDTQAYSDYAPDFGVEAPEAPMTLQQARQEQLKLAEDAIKATAGVYQADIDRLAQQGKEYAGQTSSYAVAAGLAGSPFQQAMERKQAAENERVIQARAAQRSAEVSGFLQTAETNAQQYYQDAIENFQAERQFYVDERDKAAAEQEAKREASRKAATDTIKSIASGGYSLDELSSEEYQSLLANSGYTDLEARAVWAANTPEANAKYDIIDGMFVQTYFDPHTGKPVVTTSKIPELFKGEKPDMKTIEYGGNVYWYDANKELNVDETPRLELLGKADVEDGADWAYGVSTSGREKDSKYLADAGKLADDFSQNQVVKDFAKQQEGYDYAANFNVESENPYDDQALIFAFMKVLDPTSVVREGEYATVQRNASLLETFGVKADQMLTGEQILSKNQRQNIIDTLSNRYQSSVSGYQSVVDQYSSRAQSFGIDPEDVVTSYGVGTQRGVGPSAGVQFNRTYESLEEVDADFPQLHDTIQALIDSFPAQFGRQPSEEEIVQILNEEYATNFNEDLSMSGNGSANTTKVLALAQTAKPGEKGGQCGRFVNNQTGIGMGDSLESKMALVTPGIGTPQNPPKPGDVFVMPYSWTGHTGIVKKVIPRTDGSWDLEVIDSNYGLDEKIQHHTINSRKVKGYARVPLKNVG